MPQKLRARWSQKENDVLIHYPTSPDGHYLSGVFDKKFTDELRNRGYDVTTLKFSVERRPERDTWIVTDCNGKFITGDDTEPTVDPREAYQYDDQLEAEKAARGFGGRCDNLFHYLKSKGLT